MRRRKPTLQTRARRSRKPRRSLKANLTARVRASRGARRPGVISSPVHFPDELPISAHVRELAAAIQEHPVVIVAGETGSGKTTQLPKVCLAMGRGLRGQIGVTQPRRIAATSVAARVASELKVELGREVGYQIRFANRSGPSTYVKFMTDGILLAELQGSPRLPAYDTIIVDEAHERSLNIDFLLGVMQRLSKEREDLRVIISSATLETERFSDFFGKAPVIRVSGRTFPVETIYRSPTRDESDLADAIANTVEEITSLDPRGDILVFLPGEREIREATSALTEHALPHTTLLPLYGRLSQAEQSRVFTPSVQRRVILATNVAETSLTLSGIVYVVDSGLARVNRHAPRTGVNHLLVEPISQASAEQRKGRAGRTQGGVVFRLYDEQDYKLRPAFTDPEILRVGLAGAILQMKSIGLGAIENFPFLDPPAKRSIDEGYRVLEEIGALDGDGRLTEIGAKLAKLPVDPRIGRMILAGAAEGVLDEVLTVAAALAIQDPRDRPVAAQKQADQQHARFKDDSSDFVSLLKIWRFFADARAQRSQAQMRKLCRDSFLSYVRMREWIDVREQLASIVRELQLGATITVKEADRAAALHRALLSGLLSKVALWNPEQRVYLGARQTRFLLHPSSGLAKRPPPWIVAAEIVETTQIFGRTAAKIDPEWLESIGAALCKRSYGDLYWSEKQGQVMAREQVSLYGLPVVRDRRVHYGPIDPAASRRLFIVHALARQEYEALGQREPAFVAHNRAVMEEVKQLRDRARRGDVLADEDAIAAFFERKVPDHVYSGKTFEAWRKTQEAEHPELLFLSKDDVLAGDTTDISLTRFPEQLTIHGRRLVTRPLPLSYRFDPSDDADGVTVTLPVALLPALDPAAMEWIVPGWRSEKIALLLHDLPRSYKRGLGDVEKLAKELADADLLEAPFQCSFLEALRGAVHTATGVKISREALDLRVLPPYLRFSYSVVDRGQIIATGRDLTDLQSRLEPRSREAWARRKPVAWERGGLTTIAEAFANDIPAQLGVEIDAEPMFAYPALVEDEANLARRLYPSRVAADVAMRAGLRRAVLTALGTSMDRLVKELPSNISENRAQLVNRALDEAFNLDAADAAPTSERALRARIDKGRPLLAAILKELGQLALAIHMELGPTRAKLQKAQGQPGSPKVALDDMRSQLEHLVPPNLLSHTPRSRLAHIPRYLQAIQMRLDRLPNGPQKDLSKAEQVVPHWKAFLHNHRPLLAKGVSAEDLDAFRWLVEELRVSVFAPELKTPIAISSKRLTDQWELLNTP